MIKIPQNIKDRTKGIGGSDAAAILGISKWSTPFQCYLEKIGEKENKEETEAMYFGTILEDIIANEFCKRNNKKVRRSRCTFMHQKYNFMLANLDRLLVGEKSFLECKSTSAFNLYDYGKELPPDYLCQIQHYFAVTGFERAYLAVLFGGNTYIQHEIMPDKVIMNEIINKEIFFWNENVLKRNPPEVSYLDNDFLNNKYKESVNKYIYLDEAKFLGSLEERKNIKELIRRLTDQQKEIDAKIKIEMKNNNVGLCGDYEISWKETDKGRRFLIKNKEVKR